MQHTATYTSAASPSTLSGLFRVTASGRVHDFELTITQSSGTIWDHAQGLDIQNASVSGQK
jgi:hypothetical protein